VSAGALPPGLLLAPVTGEISGTALASGTYAFTAQVTDSEGATATKRLSIRVADKVAERQPSLLFTNNFEKCSINFLQHGGDWYDFVTGDPIISDVRKGGKAHSGHCSVQAVGPGTSRGGYSKLISRTEGVNEIWGRMWIYLADSWKLGSYGAPHFWRFHNCLGSGCDEMLIDHSNYADDTLYISFMPWKPHPGGADYYFVNTGYKVSSGIGKWSCWEVHFKINDPGRSNGIGEFWVDGELQKSVTNMKQWGKDTFAGFSFIDWAGNVGGTEGQWPNNTNYWYVDDVVLGTSRIGCQ
jgi:hypothetical protein